LIFAKSDIPLSSDELQKFIVGRPPKKKERVKGIGNGSGIGIDPRWS